MKNRIKFYRSLSVLAIIYFSFNACGKNDFTPVKNNNESNLSAGEEASKPNIILIIGDDVGYEIPAYSGGQSYNTPILDFMAVNGIQFSNFFSHPDGPASRLALITGKYNFRNWVKFGYLPPKEKTIANLLADNGYATCFTGKWQYDGGDSSIKSHGFQKYRVFMPFNPADNNGHDQYYRRYKNPYLYENGQYLSDTQVENKYSEDMFVDYASSFMQANKKKPFFLLYSQTLVQRPWVPTPDDADFATWNPATDDTKRDDKKYFPGMVAYMDKSVGKIISKVNEYGLDNRTIIFYTSDNATNTAIWSLYKGELVQGAKNSTARKGINVPFVAYGPGNILPGAPDTSLIDMTDFLPSIANIAGISIPANWGPVDGTTFYDNLRRKKGKQRDWVYCYWPAIQPGYNDVSFVFDYTYKLYDSLNGGYFLNIAKDADETVALNNDSLTVYEEARKKYFQQILTYGLLHKQ